jgi:hypothetical protein
LHIALCDSPKKVRSGRHQQWRIAPVHRVEVKPDRDHLFNYREWRLHVHHAGLVGPAVEARRRYSFANGYGPILVPPKSPIPGRFLVEEDRPDRSCLGPEDRLSRHAEGAFNEPCSERWIAEDPNSCASCKTIQKPFNEADLAWVKESGHQLESVTLKLELHGRQRA